MSIPEWLAVLSNPLEEKLGVELDVVTPTRAVGRCPVAGNTQPFGIWHGGASCVLAEGLASLAAVAEVGPDGAAFGVDINATHLRPARSGWLTGVATAVRIGGSLATYEVSITDQRSDQICVARVTVLLKRSAPAD